MQWQRKMLNIQQLKSFWEQAWRKSPGFVFRNYQLCPNWNIYAATLSRKSKYVSYMPESVYSLWVSTIFETATGNTCHRCFFPALKTGMLSPDN